MPRTFFASTLALVLAAHAMAQSTLHVPSQFPTIQDAVNAATHGDTILVADGTWAGFTTDKSLTITSENGQQNCILGFVVIHGEAQSTISGFTLRQEDVPAVVESPDGGSGC
jgi:hypothetical protein